MQVSVFVTPDPAGKPAIVAQGRNLRFIFVRRAT